MDDFDLKPVIANLRPFLIKCVAGFTLAVVVMCTATVHALAPPKTPVNAEQPLSTLSERQGKIKKMVPPPVQKTLHTVPKPVPKPTHKPAGSSSAGNWYTWHNCTWYAKSRRPDLPNNLGNANTWAARARMQGIPTGVTPKIGAIGQRGMHVVYVEGVNPDGTMLISEMNYVAPLAFSKRTIPSAGWQFIY